MSNIKGIKNLELGSIAVFTLTSGKTLTGTVQRIAERGGKVASVYVIPKGKKEAKRIGLSKIESLKIKGKDKTMLTSKKKGKKAGSKSAKKTRVSKKVDKKKATKKVEKKGAGKADVKAAKAELKAAASEAKRAVTALKKAATNFVKAQKLPKAERVDLMDSIKEATAVIKESMADFKAADLKPE